MPTLRGLFIGTGGHDIVSNGYRIDRFDRRDDEFQVDRRSPHLNS